MKHAMPAFLLPFFGRMSRKIRIYGKSTPHWADKMILKTEGEY